jgi:hypothetical protein
VVEHNQRIGHIIEKIALEIFQNQGFRTEWTGVGSDFKLINQEDELGSLKIFPLSFDQNSEILIEVKATATGIAKLTMTQAQTALNYRQRYIICVLDLSSFDNTILLDDLTPTVVQTVKDSMTFVGNIANTIEEAFQKASALQLNQNIIKEVEVPPGVKITFEDSDIRIGVLKKVWAQGQLFAEIAQYCSAIFSN